MIILKHESALVDKDLAPAYAAINNVKDNEITAMFKKKEDINKMSKSVLKHRIQMLTKKNIQQIQEEMNYTPVDPNETGMNHEILKKLAHCLILLAEGQLELEPQQSKIESTGGNGETTKRTVAAEESAIPATSKKRTADALSPAADTPISKKGRRSLATVSQITTDIVDSPRRGRKSMGAAIMTQSIGTPRASRRTSGAPAATNSLNETSSSEYSVTSVAVRCMGPANGEKLKNLEEEEVEEENGMEGISNPTPAMKEILKKRRSVALTNKSVVGKKSPVKRAAERSVSPTVAKPANETAEFETTVTTFIETKKSASVVKVKKASPVKKKRVTHQPRIEFIGSGNTRGYLIAGDPLQLKIESVSKIIPLSVQFPGAHLSVVHTPHDWSPVDLHRMALTIKNLNLSAGLDSFVILAGTGFKNLKMNSEALEQISKHVQFITFHREDANKDEPPNGKLREITTLFLVAYVFPGCDKEGSELPCQMVNDGYTNCFRCKDVAQLEYSILDCFSEKGDWVLDVNCEKRKLTLAAQEQGRNSIAISPLKDDLEDLGNYLRTQSLKNDDTYSTDDGLVCELTNL
jgi:hypothetical protein